MQGMGGAGNGLFIEKSRKVNAINCSIVNFGTGIFVRYPPVDILVKNCIISSNRLFGILVSVGEKEGVYFSNITGKPTEPEKSKKGSSGIKIVSEYNDVWGCIFGKQLLCYCVHGHVGTLGRKYNSN